MNSSDTLIRLLKKHNVEFDISFEKVDFKNINLSKIYISSSENIFIRERESMQMVFL